MNSTVRKILAEVKGEQKSIGIYEAFYKICKKLSDMARIWDNFNEAQNPVPQNEDQYLKIIEFAEKKKPSRTANSQGLIKKM